jgi:cytochrome c-type biogenesis protein CcmH
VARAESYIAAHPSDGRGWDVLAPVYLRMGRFEDAAKAYGNAIRLEGETAARQSGLGEALANQAGGIVTGQAQAAFEAALKLEPGNPKASFYLAMAEAQEGRTDQAKAAWGKMLDDLPQDSPWRAAAEQALARSDERNVAANQPAKGPDQADIDAAGSMSAEDRSAMIETMVASLADRLRQNPRDAEGWMKLVRSYVVLGKQDRARDALNRGIAAVGAGSVEAKKFTAYAASLGLSATE